MTVTAALVIGFVFFQRHLIRGLGIGASHLPGDLVARALVDRWTI